MRHYEESCFINAPADKVFNFADDHTNLASHMNQSSWMMAGSRMATELDQDKGQKVGSHVKMSGNIFGIRLYLDEVITRRDSPYKKEWKTVNDLNLLVVGHYTLGYEIKEIDSRSDLKVYIDYDLPKSFISKLFSLALGDAYARWCVRMMINSVKNHFTGSESS